MKTILLSITLLTCCYLPGLAADYYWVGGSGSWNDLSHWATTSGGPLRHAVVPGATDNVIFDANSFTAPNQEVSVTEENIFANNFSWIGASFSPRFSTIEGTKINIYGSISLIEAMSWVVNGEIAMRGNGIALSIDAAGHTFPSILSFNEPSGSFQLLSDLVVDSIILLQGGQLDLGDHMVQSKYFESTTGPSTLQMNNGQLLLSGAAKRGIRSDNSQATLFLNAQQFALIPGNGTIELRNAQADLWVDGARGVDFNRLIFSNSEGQSFIGRRWWTNTFIHAPLRFNQLEVANGAIFDNPFLGGSLSLAPGKAYSFASFLNYEISELDAQGNCQQPITLSASINGLTAVIESNADTIIGEYLSLQSIETRGSANFIAQNGVDLGNNMGWDFPVGEPFDLFWVGGSGNWSDSNNWSLSSGGPGGACIPAGNTNVIFDENSFDAPGQEVILDVDQASCRDMDWSAANFTPRWRSNGIRALRIFGSFILHPDMLWSHFGSLHFLASDQGHQINTAGQELYHEVTFDGPGGEWTLTNDLSIPLHVLSLVNGHIITNDQDMLLEGFLAEGGQAAQISLGNSTIKINAATPGNGWRVINTNLVVNAGTSTIQGRGNRFLFIHSNSPGPFSYYRVEGLVELSLSHSFNDPEDLSIEYLSIRENGQLEKGTRIDTLVLYSGYTIIMEEGETFPVKAIITESKCNFGGGLLMSSELNKPVFIESDTNIEIKGFSIRDIHTQGLGSFAAIGGLDLGGNETWTFQSLARTLYWIGGDGIWHDEANWSSSSGGPGGECVPTLLDDVIFDEQSFSQAGQAVQILGEAYCKNMDWRQIDQAVSLNAVGINLSGSLWFNEIAEADVNNTYFLGDSNYQFAPFGKKFQSVRNIGPGTLSLISDHFINESTSNIQLISGAIELGDNRLSLGSIIVDNASDAAANAHLDLGSAYIELSSSSNAFLFELLDHNSLEAGSSTLEISHPNGQLTFLIDFTTNRPERLNRVIFSNPDGLNNRLYRLPGVAIQPEASYVEFLGNGEIRGDWNIDSLVLSAGKSYIFRALNRLNVNDYFYAIGNNCLQIEISSGINTIPNQFIMPASSEVIADFLQLTDIEAIGGANFFAGNHSTDISGNSGWIFGTGLDNSDEVGFLGADQIICEGSVDLTLSADNRSPGETYTWNDGSTASTLNINQAGTYFVSVFFPTLNCEVRDTVQILAAEALSVDFPPDTVLCTEEILMIDASSPLADVRYTWQDGSNELNYLIEQPGTYHVLLEKEGCTARDTIQVNYNAFPNIDLGPDTTLCETTATLLLDLTGQAENYQWQDGSTNSSYLASSNELITVTASNGRCNNSDTLQVNFFSSIPIDLGPDLEACAGDVLSLKTDINQGRLIWQEDIIADTLLVTQSGTYQVRLDTNGCSFRDSVMISFKPLPNINLGPDQDICTGSAILLANTTHNAGLLYTWNDGSTARERRIEEEGLYILNAELNGCMNQDSIQINFLETPTLELGEDTTLCDGQSLQLVPVSNANNFTISWQDGTTTDQFIVQAAGTYTATISLNGCENRDTIQVAYRNLPRFELGNDLSICAGEQAELIPIGDLENARLNWADGIILGQRLVSEAGTYSLFAERQGCTFQDTIQVVVNALPEVDLGEDITLCEGENILLNTSLDSTNNQYNWQDGSTQAALLVEETGTYSLTITRNACTASDTILVSVNPLPIFDLGPELQICENEAIEINPQLPENTSTRWLDNNQAPINRTINIAGTYTLLATLDGCSYRDSIDLIILETPQPNLGNDLILCEGETVELELDITGDYRWDDASTTANRIITEAGMYWVEVSQQECLGRDSIQVDFEPSPQIDLGPDQALCEGESVLLDARQEGVDYLWSDGSDQPTRSVVETGQYWVELEKNGCLAADTIQIQFVGPPVFDLGPDTTICSEGDMLSLEVPDFAQNWRWSDGSTARQRSLSESGEYWLEIEDVCTVRDYIRLEVEECLRFSMYVPNAFSPDGDGTNDYFRPFFKLPVEILEYQLQIFDRWGNRLYQTDRFLEKWDGMYKGQVQSSGVYVWQIELTYRDDFGIKNLHQYGDVTLVR